MGNTIQFKDMVSQATAFPSNAAINYIHDFDREGLVRGGNTIAYCLSEDGQTIYFSYSKCNIRDQYCRKVGRKLALEHAQQGQIFQIEYKDCARFLCGLNATVKDIVILRDLNFHSVTRRMLNKILLWTIIRLLGFNYYNLEGYLGVIYDNLERVPSACAICPQLAEAREDLDVCDACVMQEALYDFFSYEEDDDEDEDEEDWN